MSFEKFILDFFSNVGEMNFDSLSRNLIWGFVVFWLVVVGWVFFDISSRTRKFAFVIFCVVIVAVFNVFGLVIYLMIRPKLSMDEEFFADLEKRYLKYETNELCDCENCGYMLQPGFIACPRCGFSVKVKCTGCDVYMDKDWGFCPFCGTKNPNVKSQSATHGLPNDKVKPTWDNLSESAENQLNNSQESLSVKAERGLNRFVTALRTKPLFKLGTNKDNGIRKNNDSEGISNLANSGTKGQPDSHKKSKKKKKKKRR